MWYLFLGFRVGLRHRVEWGSLPSGDVGGSLCSAGGSRVGLDITPHKDSKLGHGPDCISWERECV